MRTIQNKRAAIELSIGTIVIIVLSMSMLILGLVLIRNIFTGAIGTSELVDRNVKAQLNKLFNEEDVKTVVYLPDNQAEIKKGKQYNVRFGIKNTGRLESTAGKFTYDIRTGEIEKGCRLNPTQAEKYLRVGATSPPGGISIAPGEEPEERIVVVEPTEDAPLCYITYELTVRKDGQVYDSNFFIIRITA